MKKFLLGLVVGLLMIPLGGYLYFTVGTPPVAVADPPFPFEKQIVHIPLHARIDRQMPHNSPIEASDSNLVAGAQIYRANCAFCHGLEGRPALLGSHLYPPVPQLWQAHGNHGVVGVSDDPVGETYWKVANGIRLTGMPAFDKVLNQTQMWQVSLLVKNADQPLGADVKQLIEEPLNLSGASQSAPATEPSR